MNENDLSDSSSDQDNNYYKATPTPKYFQEKLRNQDIITSYNYYNEQKGENSLNKKNKKILTIDNLAEERYVANKNMKLVISSE